MDSAISTSKVKIGVAALGAGAAAFAIAGACAMPALAHNAPAAGDNVNTGQATYQITNIKSKTVTFTVAKAKTAKSISVPATVKVNGKTYKVTVIAAKAFKGTKATKVTVSKNITKISKNAFKSSKVKTVVVKTKKLTKKGVKAALKGSKVKTIKINVAGGKKTDNKYVKKYKKFFSKANCGKKVKVVRG